VSQIYATPMDLVRKLLAEPLGQIVICNILDGKVVGLYDDHEIQTYFDWWRELCEYAKAKKCKSILAAMEFLTQGGIPKQLRPKSPRPEFLCSIKRSVKRSSPSDTVSAVLPALIINNVGDDKDIDRLAASGCEFPVNPKGDWSDDQIDGMFSIPNPETYFSLADSEKIGRDILWVTRTKDFKAAQHTCKNKADHAKDVLGLVHRAPPDVLVALHFPWDVAGNKNGARPIFMDAQTHRRFQAKAQTTAKQKVKSWGTTHHLETFAKDGKPSDGLLERVCSPIDGSAFNKGEVIYFTPLGRVKSKRGEGKLDNDLKYARLLLNGRTVKDIEREMSRIL